MDPGLVPKEAEGRIAHLVAEKQRKSIDVVVFKKVKKRVKNFKKSVDKTQTVWYIN